MGATSTQGMRQAVVLERSGRRARPWPGTSRTTGSVKPLGAHNCSPTTAPTDGQRTAARSDQQESVKHSLRRGCSRPAASGM